MKAALDGWTPHYADSVRWWELWKASHYLAYPFSGARLDQPAALLSDFDMYDLLSEYIELDNKLPNTAGLPKMFEG